MLARVDPPTRARGQDVDLMAMSTGCTPDAAI
jgi:hypothetical protein